MAILARTALATHLVIGLDRLLDASGFHAWQAHTVGAPSLTVLVASSSSPWLSSASAAPRTPA